MRTITATRRSDRTWSVRLDGSYIGNYTTLPDYLILVGHIDWTITGHDARGTISR